MDLALSAVHNTVFAALHCSQLRDLLSVWDCKSELESLAITFEAIRAVFCTVDRKQAQGVELNEMELVFIEKLKNAVYDADDLLDEFATISALQHQQLQNCKKVRRLFSRLEKFGVAYNMSRELKNIRKKLDGIASDADKYSFIIHDQPIRTRREETCSYVYEEYIGRDDEKQEIIDLLLEPDVQGDVDVLTIVGMGGLGKTALAQLVYNDPRIQKEFPLRLWVCVSDKDPDQFDVKKILASMYKSTNRGVDDIDRLGWNLVHKLKEELKQQKYLLVLDDVWTENHSDWLQLKQYLVGLGQRGNKIVVTTRSVGTATAVESNYPCELQALSDEDSWHLFERVVGKEQANWSDFVEIGKNIVKKCGNVPLAIEVMGSIERVVGKEQANCSDFVEIGKNIVKKCGNVPLAIEVMGSLERVVGKEQANCSDFVEIGKNIVKKCANVPLAIKVMGSLLHGESVNKWQTIQQIRFTKIMNYGDNIMPILKFSYNHLTPSLKSCFTYCALFPKDFRIPKEKVISLWMAHEYVEPLHTGQSIEEAAEEYFQILVRRCFFQIVERSKAGGILAFKVHDLMHDMAQQVSGKDIFIADSATMELDEKIRHLCDSASYDRTESFVTTTTAKIRSYVRVHEDRFHNGQFPMRALLVNWRSLRVLDLSRLNITDLPNAIGGLLHLRWLDLSFNKMKMLPKSLTKLINLQFLDLNGCYTLEELPEDFNELVNLRTLFLTYDGANDETSSGEDYGGGLRYMPLGMDKMTCLTRLNRFVLGKRKSSMKQEVRLEDIRVPRNLRGSLEICISPSYKHSTEYDGEGYLCNAEHLKSISIEWPHRMCGGERMGNGDDEVLLEDLQPHGNLEQLEIRRYHGLRIPRWAREATSLPNLKTLVLSYCDGLTELPWLGKLQHLETLQLRSLRNLEYMENNERGTNVGSSSDGAATATAPSSSTAVEITESSTFFPSLENLELFDLPKLKGWWRGAGDGQIVSSDGNTQTASDEQLLLFPSLSRVHIEFCPNLTSIPLGPAVDTLILLKNEAIEEDEDEKVVSWRSDDPKIKEITTDNVRFLKSLPMVAFQCLTKMYILLDGKIESLSEVEDVFRSCSSSLRFLTIVGCLELRSISSGLQHLTALESLELFRLPELKFDVSKGQEEEEEEEGMPWRCLAQCLHTLKLSRLEKVFNLPKGMRCLTALQSLKIKELPVKDVPEWIGCLPSLHSLEIRRCEHLESMPKIGNLTSLITDMS